MISKAVTLCICFCGLFISVPLYLLFITTEDIVAGTLIQSSVIIALYGIGDLASKLCSPFLIQRIHLSPSLVLSAFIWLISWLLIVVSEDIHVRLAGAFTVGIVNGLLLNVVLYVISLYQDIERNASAYSSGANASTFLTGFLYTSTTVWFCFPPRLTFAIVYPLTLLIIPSYVILNYGPLKKHQIQDDIKYSKLNNSTKNGRKSTIAVFFDHLYFLYEVFPFIIYSFFTALFYRLTIASTITTLTFPSAPFRVRDHFQYYTLISDIGRIAGSADLMLVSFLCPSKMDFFRVEKLWIFVFVSIGHFVFLVSASWYRFIPNVYIILVLCGTIGLCTGSLHTRIMVEVGNKFIKPSEKSLAMNMANIGSGIGILISGLLGVFLEEHLRQHCTYELLLDGYCLARFKTSLGWINNEQC